ncbi:hypothetical protein CL614_09565 [archaeon]|jgi:hypothetical protein|nr:hypothetical protein [archaeon]
MADLTTEIRIVMDPTHPEYNGPLPKKPPEESDKPPEEKEKDAIDKIEEFIDEVALQAKQWLNWTNAIITGMKDFLEPSSAAGLGLPGYPSVDLGVHLEMTIDKFSVPGPPFQKTLDAALSTAASNITLANAITLGIPIQNPLVTIAPTAPIPSAGPGFSDPANSEVYKWFQLSEPPMTPKQRAEGIAKAIEDWLKTGVFTITLIPTPYTPVPNVPWGVAAENPPLDTDEDGIIDLLDPAPDDPESPFTKEQQEDFKDLGIDPSDMI